MGTGGLNVPMFIVLRRFTFLITIFLEVSFYRKTYDRQTLGSVALMVSGAFVAAASDLTFNLYVRTNLFTAPCCLRPLSAPQL